MVCGNLKSNPKNTSLAQKFHYRINSPPLINIVLPISPSTYTQIPPNQSPHACQHTIHNLIQSNGNSFFRAAAPPPSLTTTYYAELTTSHTNTPSHFILQCNHYLRLTIRHKSISRPLFKPKIPPLIFYIRNILQYLGHFHNCRVNFIWVPDHSEIPGNELVDHLAKSTPPYL